MVKVKQPIRRVHAANVRSMKSAGERRSGASAGMAWGGPSALVAIAAGFFAGGMAVADVDHVHSAACVHGVGSARAGAAGADVADWQGQDLRKVIEARWHGLREGDPRVLSEVHSPSHLHGCALSKLMAMQRAGLLQDEGESDPDRPWDRNQIGIADWATDTDVLHYDLNIEFDHPSRWVGGSNTMTVKSTVDGLTLFRFRLRDNFNITAMTVNGNPVTWQQIDIPTVEVVLDRPYNAGEVFDLYVEYNGNPVSRGFGSINFTTQYGNPLIDTLSEPWYAYTWWPSKEENPDKTTADFRITVAGDLVVASNGLLLETLDLPGGKKQFHWQTNYPTSTYLYSLGITNYNVYEETWTSKDGQQMPFMLFTYPSEDTPTNRDGWLEIKDMLTVFSDLYGLYPFINEKYGCYQFSFGGGMEHQTITGQRRFWGDYVYINAHELGHQWWGDMITCANWENIWLNEGFATYSEALWYEFEPGGGGRQALFNHMAQRRPSRVNDSVYCYDSDNFNRIFSSDFSYRKGGWVLHMLRGVIGDDAFFDTLAEYRERHAYGVATTEDFRAAAEAVSGQDLGWFFDPWIYDIGAPAYEWGWRPIYVGDQHYIEMHVRQVQSGTYPLFPMPIEVRASQGSAVTSHRVFNDAQFEHFLIPSNPSASTVQFDPDKWILWTSANEVPFVEGPPKIVTTIPAPDAVVRPGRLNTVDVRFHEPVITDASHYTLVGDATGPVAIRKFMYSAESNLATLVPANPLPEDTYTLTVSDAVIDQWGGIALDGEMTTTVDGPVLPSGDGLPGGAAVIRFVVTSDTVIRQRGSRVEVP